MFPSLQQGVAAILLGAVMVANGCAGRHSAGALRAQSLGDDPVVLKGNYRSAFFSNDGKGAVSFVLSDVSMDEVIQGTVRNGQVLHIDLLWLPKPGATPLDSTATNASVRLMVIADGAVGLYGGAGFAMPSNDTEGDSVGMTLEDASLQLLDSTPGFTDLLSPAQLTGSFTAKRDDKRVRQLHLAASQFITNALGRPRYVRR
jgi:hypothetical protein